MGPAIKIKIKKLLHGYHRNEVALSAAYEDDKHLSFIICVKQKGASDVFLWKSVGPTIREVNDLTLLGWEEPMYWREASRLYESDVPSSEAILLGIHLFAIAKETSNVISGDTKVIVARESGMYALEANEVRELEQRVKVFTEMSDAILLALPDVTIPPVEFREYLAGFQDMAIQLHEHFMMYINHLKLERLKALPHPLDINSPELARWADDPYTQLPTIESLQRTNAEDAARIKKLAEEWSIAPPDSSAERRQLAVDLLGASAALNTAAKSNRALYKAGEYGVPGEPDAVAMRQNIASRIHKANEELMAMIELVKTFRTRAGGGND